MAFGEETAGNVVRGVEQTDSENSVAFRLADLRGQLLDQLPGDVADGQLHAQLLNHRIAQLLQLDHRNNLELQLLVVVEPGLHLAAHEKEVIGEKVLAEVFIILAEQRELVRAVVIFERELAPRLPGLGHQVLHADDHAGHGYLLPAHGIEVLQIGKLGLAHVVDDDLVVVERVGREVKPHHFALLGEGFQLAPIGAGRNDGRLDVDLPASAEKALLGVVLLGLVTQPIAYKLLHEGGAARIPQVGAEELAAVERGNRIESPGIGEVFETLAP